MGLLCNCAGLMLLAFLTPEDIREKTISVNTVLLFMILAIIYRGLVGCLFSYEMVESLIPGGILLLLSVITKESIGFGDGIVVVVLGLWTGTWFTTLVVCVAILLAGIYGVICIIKKRKDPIAFVPFLLIGMEVVLAYA